LAFCKPNKINGLGSPTKIKGWLLLLYNWFFLVIASGFTGFLLQGPGIHQIVWQQKYKTICIISIIILSLFRTIKPIRNEKF